MIRAWRHAGGGTLELVEHTLELPTLEGDQLLVRVEAAAFGRTDLSRALAGGPTPGGAGVGEVLAAGDGAGQSIGARVAFGPSLPCGECGVCRRGATGACPAGQILGLSGDGALASAVVTRARWVCRLDDGLELPGPAAALLGREAADAFGLYTRVGVGPGEPIVIVGVDATAALLAQLAGSRGGKVVQVDPADSDAADRARQAAAEAELGDRPWRVFATSAAPESVAVADQLAGPGATLALLSPGGQVAPRDLASLASRECLVVGLAAAHPDLLPEVAALAVRGDLDLGAAADPLPESELATLATRVGEGERAGRCPVVILG